MLGLMGAAVPSAGAAPHTPRIERISTAADGTQADGASGRAGVTPNGRYVAFRSSATNLVPEGVSHPATYSYIRDLRSGKVTKIEAALGTPALSADGHYAAVTEWGSHHINVFLIDLRTGERKRIDDSPAGAYSPSISANGRYIAWPSSRPPTTSSAGTPTASRTSSSRT